MFLRKLKNIFIDVKNGDVYNAEKNAMELKKSLYILQTGGTNALYETLKRDIDPTLNKLGIYTQRVSLMITIINFIIDYIEKLQVENIDELIKTLKETRDILNSRLAKEQN